MTVLIETEKQHQTNQPRSKNTAGHIAKTLHQLKNDLPIIYSKITPKKDKNVGFILNAQHEHAS